MTFDKAFFDMVVESKMYIKPTATSYFLMSVSHNTDIWKDYHVKKLKGFVLGLEQHNRFPSVQEVEGT